MKINGINVEPGPYPDSIIIEGTRYAGVLFREFGCSFPERVGQLLRVEEK